MHMTACLFFSDFGVVDLLMFLAFGYCLCWLVWWVVGFWYGCFVVVKVVCVALVCFGFSGLVTFGCYFPGDLLWLAFACASTLYLVYCLFLGAGCGWVLVGFRLSWLIVIGLWLTFCL